MKRWIGGAALVAIGFAAVTSAALQPAPHYAAPASLPTDPPIRVIADTARDFTTPAPPTAESELQQHCIGVVARQMQLARLQLRKPDLNPTLRRTYEQRRESARAFAAVLGLIGGKEGAIQEYRTGTVAHQYGLMRPDGSGVLLVTAPDRKLPGANEEALWEREQWCEEHLLDPLSRE
jgi:hypothetical protein